MTGKYISEALKKFNISKAPCSSESPVFMKNRSVTSDNIFVLPTFQFIVFLIIEVFAKGTKCSA